MKIRVFVSSPSDVIDERAAARSVLEELRREYRPLGVDIEPLFWEDEPLRADHSPQPQIPRASECAIVICILWSRIGTPLPHTILRDDGTPYESGTVFEFEDAMRAAKEKKTDFLVYRKTAPLRLALTDKNSTEIQELVNQKNQLDAFLKKWFENDDGTLCGAFHRFPKVGEFERQLEIHVRAVIKARTENVGEDIETKRPEQVPSDRTWADGSPFRGLEKFELEHAAVYYGREEAIEEVRESLVHRAQESCCSFLLIAGSSGSGKSSLIHAGLLPRLMRSASAVGVSIRPWATMRPADVPGDPIAGLARALLHPRALSNELADEGLQYESLVKILEQDAESASATIERIIAHAATREEERGAAGDPMARLILIVDQLEEIFALTSQSAGRERVEQFVRILSCLAHRPANGILVIAAIRSDFYRRCEELQDLMALKNAGKNYHLAEPKYAEFARIIQKPAAAAGLKFEDNLDDEILQDAMANPNALPLLEFTLKLLHQRCAPNNVLTREAYRQIGGVEGAIQRRAHDVLCRLDVDVKKALPHVLRSLVRIDLREDCAAKRNASSEVLFASHPKAEQFVNAFADARLLVLDKDRDEVPVVSVVHEALLRGWEDAQEWIQENKMFLRFRERATEAAIRWDRSGRAESELITEGSFLVEAEEFLDQAKMDLEAPLAEEFIANSRQAAEQRRDRRLAPLRVLFACLCCAISGFFGCVIAVLGHSSLLCENTYDVDLVPFLVGRSSGAAIGGMFWGIIGLLSWEIVRAMGNRNNYLRDILATLVGGLIGGLMPAILVTWSWNVENAYVVFLVGGAVWGALLGIGLVARQRLAEREFEPFGTKGLLVGAACFLLVFCLTTVTTWFALDNWSISWGQGLIFASGHIGVFFGLFLTDVLSERVYR